MSRAPHKRLTATDELFTQLVERVEALEATVAKLEKALKAAATKAAEKPQGKGN